MVRCFLMTFFCCIRYFAIGQDCLENLPKSDCLKLLATYQEFWRDDSLAKNGSRNIIGTEFLRHFRSLEGSDWNEVVPYLGASHFIFRNVQRFVYQKDEVWYRYVLHSYRGYKNYKDVGSRYLDVIVVDGKIKSISMHEVDG